MAFWILCGKIRCSLLRLWTSRAASGRINLTNQNLQGQQRVACPPEITVIRYLRGDNCMETKEIILKLRTQKGLSQDQLAEKVHVTRQAVSRWETGETVPNTETLKLLSKFFDVSINTLLGTPRQLVCQCCGMPLDDTSISKEVDGTFNEEYCKWCYSDGEFAYTSVEELTDFLVGHMSNENWPAEQVRAYVETLLPTLKHWQCPND